MDRLVDEAEGLAVDSSSSVCSGAGGGGRLETTTDQQLSLLNSITASDLTGQETTPDSARLHQQNLNLNSTDWYVTIQLLVGLLSYYYQLYCISKC